MALTAEVRRLYAAFRGKTGCVGRDAKASLAMAKALAEVRGWGWTFDWVDDPDGMPRDGLCSCGCGLRIERSEGCVLVDEQGEPRQSLWAIWDASPDYRRQVEAELALEAVA